MKYFRFSGVAAFRMPVSGSTVADLGSQDPIKLTLHDWSDQLLAREALTKAGTGRGLVAGPFVAISPIGSLPPVHEMFAPASASR